MVVGKECEGVFSNRTSNRFCGQVKDFPCQMFPHCFNGGKYCCNCFAYAGRGFDIEPFLS